MNVHGRQVLWEKRAVADREQYRAVYRRRWMIVGIVAAVVSVPFVLAQGVWGLVPAALIVGLGGGAVELVYRMTTIYPDQRVWTDGSMLGVDGASRLVGRSLEPVPIDSIARLTVYPVDGGAEYGPSRGGVSMRYVSIDLWLTNGDRQVLTLLCGRHGITSDEERALAVSIRHRFADRWGPPPTEEEQPAFHWHGRSKHNRATIDRERVASWML